MQSEVRPEFRPAISQKRSLCGHQPFTNFNNIPAATAYLRQTEGESAISVITRAEVLAGFDLPQARLAMQLLDQFPTLAVDVQVADLAAALRREQGWKLPDALQAALAQLHHLTLVTRNSRDFPPARYDFVLIPYTLAGC